nr:F0F1 ATP synthase subunit B' [Puniceibacterium sp. IMCC21224]
MGVQTHDAASAPGMPQLNFDHWGNQIFWLVLALLAIYFVLSRIALPRIAAVLAERQGTITNDIAKAEDLRRQATEAEQAYEKALSDARIEAQAIALKTRDSIKAAAAVELAKADGKIAEKTAEADKAIAEIRASAMENVEVVAKDTAEALVAAMGSNADTATVADAVANRMKG